MRFLPLVVLLVITSNVLSAEQLATPPETLRPCLSAPVVVVFGGDKPEWLSQDTLKAYIVRRLETAKIPTKPSDGIPSILTLTVDTLDAGAATAFSARLGFSQPAILLDSQVAVAETWRVTRIGIITPGNQGIVRDGVSGMVDEFIAAWSESHTPPTKAAE